MKYLKGRNVHDRPILIHFSEFIFAIGSRIFPKKWDSVTFEHLWTPNFMQKNRKKYQAYSENTVYLIS